MERLLGASKNGNVCIVMHGPRPDSKALDKAMRLGAIGWLVKSGGGQDHSDDHVDQILRWYSNIGGAIGSKRRTTR